MNTSSAPTAISSVSRLITSITPRALIKFTSTAEVESLLGYTEEYCDWRDDTPGNCAYRSLIVVQTC
jgi:hypothetical protein